MSQYIIIKKNDRETYHDRFDAYCGPACAKAGVETGIVYHDKNQAEKDAARLGIVNPIGFEVVELNENWHTCPECRGTGYVYPKTSKDENLFDGYRVCRDCDGEGKTV